MSRHLFDLTGKTALVTGATHGIGMAIARGLADFGARLCVNGTSPERLEAAKATYAEAGVEVHTRCFDVTDEGAVDAHVRAIEEEVGPIDILVNNAGIIKRVPILEMEVDAFRQVLEVDLVGPLIMAKRIAPSMIERGAGKIINLCSMMSEYGRFSVSGYASAKGGLKLLTQNMCCEWARFGLNINGLGPGYIATSQTAPIREAGHPFNELVMARTPAQRWGDPEDLIGATVLLASEAGRFINGQVIYVDGGILANFGNVKGENTVRP